MSAESLGYQASTAVSSVQTVRTYRDVLGRHNLAAGDALTILDALVVATIGQAVFWAPDWFTLDESITTVTDDRQIFAAAPERDSADAWQIDQDGATAWVPKRHALAFERADDAKLPTVPRCEQIAGVIR